MATTHLTGATTAIGTELAVDFPAAPPLVHSPYDLEPEMALNDPSLWPGEGDVAFLLVDGVILAEEPARGEQKRHQEAHPELQVWMKAATRAALRTLFDSTRRQVFLTLERIERTYPYSSNRWTLLWRAGGSKAGRSNNGFHAVLRVDLQIEFNE